MVALGLRCCVQAFSSLVSRGCSLLYVGFSLQGFPCCYRLKVHGLPKLQHAGSAVVTCGFQQLQLKSSRARAQQLCAWALVALHMWDLPNPRIKPMSPALAGRFLSTVSPEKSCNLLLSISQHYPCDIYPKLIHA